MYQEVGKMGWYLNIWLMIYVVIYVFSFGGVCSLLFHHIVMQTPKVTFHRRPLPTTPIINPLSAYSHPPANLLMTPHPISRSPIRPPHQLVNCTGTVSQPIRDLSPKKVDINLNIHVDGEGTVTANTNTDAPNYYLPGLVSQHRQNYAPHYGVQGGNGHEFQQYHADPLSMPSKWDDDKALEESKVREKMSYNERMVQESVFCVICNEEYTESQRDDHIKKHQRTFEEGMTRIRSKDILDKFAHADQPIMRPIVQPEQYHVQYQPRFFVPEQEINNDEGHRDHAVSAHDSHFPQNQQLPISSVKREENIRISFDNDMEQIELENYSKHQMHRKNKQQSLVTFSKNQPSFMDKERFVRESFEQEQANEPLRVIEQNRQESIKDFDSENFKGHGRETIVLQNEREQLRDMEDSNHRRASVRKRVYNSEKYSEDERRLVKVPTTDIVTVKNTEGDKLEDRYESSPKKKRTYQSYEQAESTVHPVSTVENVKYIESHRKKPLVEPLKISQQSSQSQRQIDTSRTGEMKDSFQVFESQRNNEQFAKYLRDSNPFPEQSRTSQQSSQNVLIIKEIQPESRISQQSKQSSHSQSNKYREQEMKSSQKKIEKKSEGFEEKDDKQSQLSRRSKRSNISKKSQVSSQYQYQQDSKNVTSFKKKRLPVVHQL